MYLTKTPKLPHLNQQTFRFGRPFTNILTPKVITIAGKDHVTDIDRRYFEVIELDCNTGGDKKSGQTYCLGLFMRTSPGNSDEPEWPPRREKRLHAKKIGICEEYDNSVI